MSPQVIYGSSGAVLAVDDAPDVRRLVHGSLTKAGYSVFLADSCENALSLFRKHSSEITLLLTDVVAPGMSGPMLADQVLSSQPHLKVIFTSDVNASHIVRRFVTERGFQLITKPFTPDTLVAAVRQAIGPAQRAASGGL